MSVLEKIFNNNFYREGFAQTQNEEIMDNIQKSIHINVINDCNMRCKHCFINAGKSGKATDRYRKYLSKSERHYNNKWLYISNNIWWRAITA